MVNEPLHQPELHEPALHLIDRVAELHAAGSGALKLVDILEAFHIAFAPAERERLLRRDDLTLTARDASGGTFLNQGEPLDFSQNNVRLRVPAELRGQYTLSDGGVQFTFETDATVSGVFLLYRATLNGITLDQENLKIDVSEDAFDQLIRHAA